MADLTPNLAGIRKVALDHVSCWPSPCASEHNFAEDVLALLDMLETKDRQIAALEGGGHRDCGCDCHDCEYDGDA